MKIINFTLNKWSDNGISNSTALGPRTFLTSLLPPPPRPPPSYSEP